jgi:thiol-disulfide isomerase/thioredoxin
MPAFALGAASDESPVVGGHFPPFAGTTIGGEQFDLGTYYNTGKYIFIDFWAFWCGPCKRAMPDVVSVWKDYGGDRFTVVGVNMDTPATEEKMRPYIEETGITFPCVTELAGWNTTISVERGIHYIPQNFLLAPDGTVLFKDLHGDELKETVKMLLSRENMYKPIIMRIEVDKDPRNEPGYLSHPPKGDMDIYIDPFAKPLNAAPDEIQVRVTVDDPEANNFQVVLSCELTRSTGRRTYMVKDPATEELYRLKSGEPYIFHEVANEKKEAILKGTEGHLDTGFIIPVGADVWAVSWELRVFSTFLNREITGASDSIDFAGYYFISPEDIEKQGGIIYGKTALEEKPAEQQ